MSTFIIAEIGVNHNGDIDIAKQLINLAAIAGVNAVKFQAFQADKLVRHTDSTYKLLKQLELNKSQLQALKKYCKFIGIQFICSPFDIDSIKMLDEIGTEIFKIPSGEITNYPYLIEVAKLNKQIILSTGMATMQEINDCCNVLVFNGTIPDKLTILHCTTEYPTPMKNVNLSAMQTIADVFGTKVGYSDHTTGIEVAIAAVAMGATVIEKHFTLDKNMDGPDHASSANPNELIRMVRAIKNIDVAMGTPDKAPTSSEQITKCTVRKSIVASEPINVGTIFTEDNLTTMRGDGINPMQLNTIIGTTASKTYKKYEVIHD